METADGDTVVNYYFYSFTVEKTCFNVEAFQQTVIENLLSSSIEVSDYYNCGNDL